MALALQMFAVTSLRAQPESQDENIPAEELRLDPAVFRAGLKKLGLNDVLELHLRDFPPGDEVARLMMIRDIRMAEFADRSLSEADRIRAADEANAQLEQIIAEHRDDPRRFDWQFELAHSLIYDQAEPLLTRLMYQEPPVRDDARLSSLTGRAAVLADELLQEIDAEFSRIDGLSAEEFEALERTGYVERLDRLSPQTQYLRLWAFYYDAFHRRNDDPTKASRLKGVSTYFGEHPAVLATPHEQSRVQVQTLLLAGMTARALHDHAAARDLLTRALAVADGLDDAERARVAWAISIAWLEHARNDRDDSRFDAAHTTLDRFLRTVSGNDSSGFGLRLARALCERSVWYAQADAARKAHQPERVGEYRAKGWKALATLVEAEPEHRDEAYAAVYLSIDSNIAPDRLDPLEQSAAVAGLLRDAEDDPGVAEARLGRAVKVAERFLADSTADATSLTPHVLFNLAVAHYRLGDVQSAAVRFVELARDFPRSARSYRAATLAVEILAAEDRERTSASGREERAAYRSALELLLRQYPGTDAEGYWRFFYAQLLDESGEHGSAAEEYALVDPGHEHYVESIFLRLRSLAIGLHEQAAASDQSDLFALRNVAEKITRLEREFASQVASRPELHDDAERGALLDDMRARSRVIAAEVLALPQIGQPQAAIELVGEFETAFAGARDLLGRVWRVRLLSLERLGRLDEAIEAIPSYAERDPEGAGRTLQSLYESMAGEAEQLRERGDTESAKGKADIALLLARQLNQWATLHGDKLDADRVREVRLQFAQACLNAGRFDEARSEFEGLATMAQGANGPPHDERRPRDARVTFGLAEARFQLGDYEAALAGFNKLATTLAPEEPLRWRALLRDLQCRTVLKEPQEGIIKVILQQRYLYPGLGGVRFAEEFEKVQRENERRRGANAP